MFRIIILLSKKLTTGIGKKKSVFLWKRGNGRLFQIFNYHLMKLSKQYQTVKIKWPNRNDMSWIVYFLINISTKFRLKVQLVPMRQLAHVNGIKI